MRKSRPFSIALFALLLGLAGPVCADRIGVTDSLSAVNAESRYGGDDAGTIGFQLTGTWSATMTFEGTINGTTWTAIYAFNRATATGATTATANGTYALSTAGVRYVRVRVSAYTSGTVAVTGLLSSEQSVIDGGGGGGTGGGGDASAANQTSGNQLTQVVDSTGQKVGVTNHAVQVNCGNCSGSGVSATDSSAFANASTAFATVGGEYQSNQTANPLANGRQGAAQMTRYRAPHVNLRDTSGVPLGTAGNPIRSDPTGTTVQPVSASALPLPTGAATEATLAAESAKLPATLGQKAMAASMSMVLASDQSSIPTAATLQAGSATVGKVGIDQTTPGTTNGVVINSVPADPFGANADAASASGSMSAKLRQIATNGVPVTSLPALPTGGNTIGKVDPGTAANFGIGATGSAVPANAVYQGAVSSGNLVGIIQADASAKIDVSTATTTQIVALTSGKKIYVTTWNVLAAGTGTFKLVYGTGSSCGTGTTDLTGAYSLVAQAGLSGGGGLGPTLVVPASNALCAVTSAAVGMQGSVAYTQF